MIIKVKLSDILKFEVSYLCYESYPCRHKLFITLRNGEEVNSSKYYNSLEIIFIYNYLNIPLPIHFLDLTYKFDAKYINNYILNYSEIIDIYDKSIYVDIPMIQEIKK